jgi:hypothetical protein
MLGASELTRMERVKVVRSMAIVYEMFVPGCRGVVVVAAAVSMMGEQLEGFT